MKLNKEKIFEILSENKEFLKRQGVRKLELFGSYARGEESSSSDIDFIIDFEKKTFDGYMNVKLFLEDVLKCPVDLVLENTIKPSLRDAILREAVHAPGL